MEKVNRKQLLGQFLVITGGSAMVVLWAVNTVQPILQSANSLPMVGLLLGFVLVGLFLQSQSA